MKTSEVIFMVTTFVALAAAIFNLATGIQVDSWGGIACLAAGLSFQGAGK